MQQAEVVLALGKVKMKRETQSSELIGLSKPRAIQMLKNFRYRAVIECKTKNVLVVEAKSNFGKYLVHYKEKEQMFDNVSNTNSNSA